MLIGLPLYPYIRGSYEAGPHFGEGLYFFGEANLDRVAVFVDAGHVFAGGSAAITGAAKKRHEITLNVPVLADLLKQRAVTISGRELLRIYWYDGALSAGLTTDQQLLASTDNIKLRLGIVNGHGEQKGVDAKIVTDLAELARNCAICDAILIGGDEDLRIGVELAQERGVRVHLLTVEKTNVSIQLKREADTTHEIAVDDVKKFLTFSAVAAVVAAPATVAMNAAASTSKVASVAVVDTTKVVDDYLTSLSPAELAALTTAVKASPGVPADHDGKMIARARDSVGRQLVPAETKALRLDIRAKLEG